MREDPPASANETTAPFTYACDAPRRTIRVVARRRLTVDEVVGIIDRQCDEGRWSFGILYDLRRVDEALSKEDAMRVAEHARNAGLVHGPRGPVALVARTEMVAARQIYAIRTKRSMQVEVFWDVDEAEAWLTECLQRRASLSPTPAGAEPPR